MNFLTYNLLKSNHQHKTTYIPHSFPDNVYYPLNENSIKEYKSQVLGKEKLNDFTVLWANRNTRRKRPADLLKAWQIFLFNILRKKLWNGYVLTFVSKFLEKGIYFFTNKDSYFLRVLYFLCLSLMEYNFFTHFLHELFFFANISSIDKKIEKNFFFKKKKKN